MIPALLASIPSPDSGAIHIGPLQLRAYGLMIALGVIAAVWLTGRRIVERRIGKAEDASAVAALESDGTKLKGFAGSATIGSEAKAAAQALRAKR